MTTTSERGACSVPHCDEPKHDYESGYPCSMCREHDQRYSQFRREMSRRTGSSRGAATLFYQQVAADRSAASRA